MQVVRFPSLGNVEGSAYVRTVVEVVQKIAREDCTERDLKRWMRGKGCFDKGSFDVLKTFLGLSAAPGGKLTLSPFAQALVDTDGSDKLQDLSFERMAGSNEILAKYVFDALQERLYSTSELYRMLTSYVYPGQPIDLPDFNHWLKWMEGTERIRILGIRWAPGKRYEASASFIASIDVDEILEEEAEEAMLGDAAEPEPPAPTPAPTPTPEPEPEPEPEPNIGWEPPEDDEEAFEDEPAPASAPIAATTGAGISVEALVQALAQAGPARSPELIEARLLKPAPHLSALAAGAPLERVKEAMEGSPRDAGSAWLEALVPGEEALAENTRALLDWWSGREDRPLLRADQFGLMPFGAGGWEDGSRARFLFRLGALAVSIFRSSDVKGAVAFETLDGSGFFTALFDEAGSTERLLDELFEQGLGGRPELFEQLHLYLMLARSLRGAEEWCAGLADLSGDQVLAALWQRLAAFQLSAEALWMVRELSMFGILRQDALREVRLVPTEEARRAAFHLGFIESPRAGGLPSLLALSRRLSPLMGNELEGPLVAFWRAYGASPPKRFWSR